MDINDENDFEAYCTRVWLTKTDRGGLLHVTDDVFRLFCRIEVVVCEKLKKVFKGQIQQQSEASLTVVVASDSDIQFVWSVVTHTEDEDNQISQQLLTSILKEWVVLRGHSLCNEFMEKYKRLHAQTKEKKSFF